MNSHQRAAAAEAVLSFLEKHCKQQGDVVRVVVEVEDRGRIVHRLRYCNGKGRARFFKRSYLHPYRTLEEVIVSPDEHLR